MITIKAILFCRSSVALVTAFTRHITEIAFLINQSWSARVFGYTVYRGFLNRVYGIFQLKYGYSVYHFL